VGPQSVTPPAAAPASPGVSLAGSKLLLAGAAALASLRGAVLGHVSDVTLADMPCSKVGQPAPVWTYMPSVTWSRGYALLQVISCTDMWLGGGAWFSPLRLWRAVAPVQCLAPPAVL
jgi:hypothetical protein